MIYRVLKKIPLYQGKMVNAGISYVINTVNHVLYGVIGNALG